jgi:quercetin dioxygenase-like cupin family protein
MRYVYERPFQPTAIDVDTLRAFPLSDMTEQLKAESTFRNSGRDALTLVHGPNLTLVLTVVRGGAACNEHRSPGPAAIILLSGTLVLSSRHADTPATLEAGSMVAVGRNVVHVLTAKSDAVFLTIIGRQQHAGRTRARGRSTASGRAAATREARPRKSPSPRPS